VVANEQRDAGRRGIPVRPWRTATLVSWKDAVFGIRATMAQTLRTPAESRQRLTMSTRTIIGFAPADVVALRARAESEAAAKRSAPAQPRRRRSNSETLLGSGPKLIALAPRISPPPPRPEVAARPPEAAHAVALELPRPPVPRLRAPAPSIIPAGVVAPRRPLQPGALAITLAVAGWLALMTVILLTV
jgi:hypothetical protein